MPLDDRIIVEPNEAAATTRGGLFLPDTAKEKPQRGTVLAVGPGKFVPELLNGDPLLVNWASGRMPIGLEPGDVVVFARYSGYEAPGEDDLLILRADDVLAKVAE